jgi:hypothetical protein
MFASVLCLVLNILMKYVNCCYRFVKVYEKPKFVYFHYPKTYCINSRNTACACIPHVHPRRDVAAVNMFLRHCTMYRYAETNGGELLYSASIHFSWTRCKDAAITIIFILFANNNVQSLPDKLRRRRRRDNGKPVVLRISILLLKIYQ